MNFYVLSIFRKSSGKISSLIKIGQQYQGNLHEDQYTFLIMSLSLSVLLRMRKVSLEIKEKIKTHNVYSIFFFSKIVPFMR